MRNILIFYNPNAGRKTNTNPLHLLTEEIEKLGDCYQVIPEDPNTLQTLPNLRDRPADLVVVFGGDGTVRAVAQLILESGSRAPVAVIPAGSGNLLAFALKVPSSIRKAVKLALEGTPTEIDVGLLNKKDCFLIAFALGYVTELIATTPRSIKKRLGIFAYVLHFFRNLKIRRSEYEISVDGARGVYEGNTILVVNTLRVFGSRACRNISFRDGLLNVFVLANKNMLRFFDTFYYFFLSPKAGKNFIAAQGKEIEIILEKGTAVPASIDGEAIKLDSQKAIVEVSARKLRVISSIPPKDI